MDEPHSETDDSETSENSDESDSSEDRDSETFATKNDYEAGTSQEEDNFLRYFLLAHLAVDAVRVWFDTIVPPRKLEKHLKRHKKKAFKNCSAEQKDVLFPDNPVTSEKFDITLFYKIIRNTTDVKKPTKGWGEEPDPSDIEPADDLERVRICRNSLSHCPPSISDGDFEKKWKELSEVIKRLGKGQLDGKVDFLKDKILDCSTRSSLRLDLAALRERVGDVEKSVADHIPRNLKEQYKKSLHKWKEDDRIFSKTHSYQAIFKKIKSSDHVTVAGGGGTGKTSLVRHVALRLAEEGFEILPVSSIDEIILCGNLSVKQVFVVDDVLGVHGLDLGLYNSLMAKSESVFNLLETGSKLMMTCRSVVLKETKSLNSFVTHFDHVIDLGDEKYRLTDEDKRVMLGIHCQNRQIRKEYFENLSLYNSWPMFPLLCRVFVSCEKYQEMGEQFFHSPYKCLFSELSKMQAVKKIHYASLVYCVMKGNCVAPDDLDTTLLEDVYNYCRLNKSTSDWELQDSLRALVGSYLDQDTYGRFSVIHDKLLEIVAVHFGKQFPECLIKHSTSCFIYKFITVEENESIINENCICVPENNFPVLVNRVIRDIRRFHLYEVFICDILKNTNFVSMFCKICSNFPLQEIKTLFFDDNHSDLLYGETYEKLTEMSKLLELAFDTLGTCCESNKRKFAEIDWRYYFLNRRIFKVLYWIIGYGHVSLLSGVIQLVHSKTTIVNKNIPASDANVMKVTKSLGMDLESQGTCLALACASGSTEMVTLVLEQVEPECMNKDFFALPLRMATLNGRNDIVQILLEEGASDKQNFAISHACLIGHNEVMENFITHGYDVNAYSDEIPPLLSIASVQGYMEIVKNLIKHGALVNLSTFNSAPPLFSASLNGHLGIVKYLIKCGADVNLCANDGSSSLSVASFKGHLEIATYLIKNGADVNNYSKNGASPLFLASRKGHLNIVKYLTECGVAVNLCDKHGRSPVSYAAFEGHLEIVKHLIKCGADVNLSDKNRMFPLFQASRCGHIEIVKYLTKNGAVVNLCTKKGNSPFSIALRNGHLQVLKILIECGANVNLCDSTLFHAAGNGHLDIVKYLIECGLDTNLCDNNGISSLSYASYSGHLDAVKYLVKCGADVRLCDNNGLSPLSYASSSGQLEIVKYLIECGVDTNLCDNHGISPLSYASYVGHPEIVKYLIKRRADVNLCDNDGVSPLSYASYEGHLEIVKYLIDCGADVNLCDKYGRSPLSDASYGGHLEIVKYVIKLGANVNPCNSNFRSPLCYASSKGHLGIVKYLNECGKCQSL